jgi:tetratricopeptide (TPR) repeat protein
VDLGALYQYAGFYQKSEHAMRHVIDLLRTGRQDLLATAIGHLAILHNTMGQAHQAEKEQLEVLKIRHSIGDPVAIAQTEIDLANVFIKQGKYKQAVDYARHAEDVIADNPKVPADSRIAARENLAYALCGIRQCDKAIPLLLDAIQIARTNFGPDSLAAGISTYLLGFAYWHSGNPDAAAEFMERGIQRMKVDLGWGQVIYVNAIGQYAKFLRQRGETEAARVAEREVRQTAAVVDARSFTARPQ